MSGGRTPLGDVTNTMRGSQIMPQLNDAKECKQAKERARYASMSLDQINEKNKNTVNPGKEREVTHPTIFRFYVISFLQALKSICRWCFVPTPQCKQGSR
jgi:hypothetical protein